MTRTFLTALTFVLAAAITSLSAQEIQKNGVTLPSPVRTVKAGYTAAAMEARIEGKVLMDVAVLEDGKVGEVKVTQSLDTE